ncbi:hypothetical protein DICPUDRAFT_79545 [Dictyostelium purpureum]|uniref:Transcription initiation factor TFIID subunit 8 n=1 Tax=Dictyostelium purpureum TaxID=5786 RepID=F0ZMX1_DICPU|nr:uncharacterized protein DICPUDRAFT_79545 [Dictyostelium purpureum]EGC34725.1 hypothetical protein DICPUDRAFT_79545 [Dictyostelium purpureum]|eukprot:XP_003288766.1 hypothetical protein DICPUDRAFT_79545 [Dictyostelium purpureum]
MCDNYARVLCKMIVAQIARSNGFHSISQIACDSLADVIQIYIQDIGIRAHEYSELSCRTDSNFFDVKQSFEDMAIDLQELQQYLLQSDEIPFGQVVPPFPLPTTDSPQKSQYEQYEQQKQPTQDFPLHIPSFLPSPPEKHTFSKTPLYGEVVTDPYKIKKVKNKQKRQVENSLIKLTDISSKKIPNYDMIKQKIHSKKEEALGVNNNNEGDLDNNNNNNIDKNKTTTENGHTNGIHKETNGKPPIIEKMNLDDDNNNNDSNKNKEKDKEKDKEKEIKKISSADTIAPTPLESISNTFYQRLEEEDLKKHEDTAPRRSLLSEEDQERAKKRMKCERILSFNHESLSTINEDDKDKDDQ